MTTLTLTLNDPQVKYLHFLVNNDVKDEPEYISKNEAYDRFGQGNVKRWLKLRKVLEYKRPGKIQLRLSELRDAAADRQDYLYK